MSFSRLKQWTKGQQWLLWVMVFLMGILSLNTLYSLLYSTSQINIFYNQLAYIFIGLGLAVFIARYDYRVLKRYNMWWFGVALLLMGAVLIGGLEIRGTSAWLDLKVFSFQPVEIAKISIILILAAFLARYHSLLYSWKVLIFSFLIPLPFILLTLLQPDLGSALVLIGIWTGTLMVSAAPLSKKIILLAGEIGVSVLAWFFFLKDYQKARLTTFLHPEQDPLGIGYNTLQSVTAIGSGGMSGKGLGYGSQSQLNFIPEAHSDFIFAVFAEETGWIGALFFFVIFFLLCTAILSVARRSRDNFGYFLVIGCFWFFLIHFFINIGMNLGLLPVIGIPLPFVSAGGTHLLTSFILVGIMQSVSRLGVSTDRN